jgi:hypothetical protein
MLRGYDHLFDAEQAGDQLLGDEAGLRVLDAIQHLGMVLQRAEHASAHDGNVGHLAGLRQHLLFELVDQLDRNG